MILNQSEIFQLTGKKRSNAQAAVLNYLGIEHKVRLDGSIVVSKAHVEQMLGSNTQNRLNKAQEPNWKMVNA